MGATGVAGRGPGRAGPWLLLSSLTAPSHAARLSLLALPVGRGGARWGDKKESFEMSELPHKTVIVVRPKKCAASRTQQSRECENRVRAGVGERVGGATERRTNTRGCCRAHSLIIHFFWSSYWPLDLN